MKCVLDGDQRGDILNNLQRILSIAPWDILQFGEVSPSCGNIFLIIPLAENMEKLVPDKLQKQLFIYVPFIPKTFNHTCAMENSNRKPDIHMSSSPFFLALGIAFPMHPLPFLSPHMSPWYSCLLARIFLSDLNSPIKIEGYSLSPEV